MKLLTKVLIGLGVSGSAFAGWRYFTGMKKAFEDLEILSNVTLNRITLDGIELRLDLTMKNPSDQALSLKFPFIKVLYKDKIVGTSQVVNTDIKIPAHGEARVEKIMIKMPLAGLLDISTGVISSFKTGIPVNLKVATKTTIDTGVNKIPHESVNNVTLKS